MKFVQELIEENLQVEEVERIVIIWDGAPYHRSQEF
jgi:hypothetical protein